jgi:hypothetical protein
LFLCILPVYLGAPYAFFNKVLLPIKKKKPNLLVIVNLFLVAIVNLVLVLIVNLILIRKRNK